MRFTRLTTANGLSQSTINTIVKDKAGFMWFGTVDGLNRFDGYNFKNYRNIPGDPTSLPYNLIKILFVDQSGTLWVGTLGGGLASYDEKNDVFRRYDIGLIQSIFEDSTGILWVGTFDGMFMVDKRIGIPKRAELYHAKFRFFRKKMITSILEDKEKNLWVGTGEGLYLLHTNSSKITSFFSAKIHEKQASSEISAIAKDQMGRLWVGTREGLYQYNYESSRFLAVRRSAGREAKTIQVAISALFCDANNILWVGTDDGLGRYDADKSSFHISRTDAYDEQSLSRNSVSALYVDNQILWVGTALGGVNKYDKQQSFVSHYRISNSNNPNANTNVVTSFAGSFDQELWIGTDGGGLFTWDATTNNFKPVRYNIDGTSTFGNSVLCLLKSRDGRSLWIGTYSNGLFQLDLRTKRLTRYNTLTKTLNNNAVYAILEDQRSNIWVGTNGGGVSVISPSGRPVLQLTVDLPGTLTNNYIRALMEDEKGDIWIGTYGGVNIYNPGSRTFVAPKPLALKLYRHLISALYRDSSNRVWIGTHGAGLFIYDRRKYNVVSITEAQGLSNNNVSSITDDNQGFVWVSTTRGLNRLSKNNKAFTSFLSEDGLQTDEFTGGAGFLCASGKVLFGSVDGFHLVDPENYKRTGFVPPVVITDFKLPSNSFSFKHHKGPKFNVTNGLPVSLAYNQSVFTIEYAALNYSSTTKSKYACKLEGLDDDWQYLGHERKVTYNNLSPGEYVFRVKAASNDGIWNDAVTSLKIIILPPLWRTTWAYLLYALVTFFVFNSIFNVLRIRGKLKNELILQKLAADKMEEMNQMKLNFFTKVSHELRTPLSLIIDPIRRISEEDIPLSQTKLLSRISFRNASRLLNMVNQLLDFRKFEGSLILETATVDIKNLVRDVALAFNDRAKKCNLDFITIFHLDFPAVTIDPDKFQKILINLISNAFKFTPEGGKIILTTSIYVNEGRKRQLEIRLADTGPGVPAEYKAKVFEMFFQVKQTSHVEIESSGIGLALVKELVQLHDGEIHEIGNEGEGAVFVLKMPAGEVTSLGTDITTRINEPDWDEFAVEELVVNSQDALYNTEVTILVVEDNDELRNYIAAYLSTFYVVEVASNGQEGYQKAIASIPNLIVSDVMMKEGDGLELCQKVRSDERTSHIPVILLTAKQADESKIQGYNSGADAYISKPFNSELLQARISNLLESRKMLRESYMTCIDPSMPGQQNVSEIDLEFLEKARQAVLANLLEANFDIEAFAKSLNMNRRQLARKLKAITNQTPQEYFIDVRLKTAIELILHQDLNISQAAYEVGFSEPANFSRSFSKVYGQSPRNYLKEKHGKIAF